MTTAFSLRDTIAPLSDAKGNAAPVTPDFPYSVAVKDGNQLIGRLSTGPIVSKIRNNEVLFTGPTSLYMTTAYFREFFPTLRREMFRIRVIQLDGQGCPYPIFDPLTNKTIAHHQINDGDTIVFACYDEISSRAYIQFLKVTERGVVPKDDKLLPFVNLEPLVTVIDVPGNTDITKNVEDCSIADAVIHGVCWNVLSGFTTESVSPTLEQHLTYVGRFDFEKFVTENGGSADFLCESKPSYEVLSYLQTIYAARQSVFPKHWKNPGFTFEVGVNIAPAENGFLLKIVTLPTSGIRAFIAMIEVPLTQDEYTYILTAEPSLTVAANGAGTYSKFSLHY